MRDVFGFDEDTDTADPRGLLGGKGAALARMTAIGLPVPPGFTVTTAACRAFLGGDGLPSGLADHVSMAAADLGTWRARHLGDTSMPLLVSVRSGASVSMPGMMDTVLNVGLNAANAEALADATADRRFAFDTYRRFISSFGQVVLRCDGEAFEEAAYEELEAAGVGTAADLDAAGMERLARRFERVVVEETGAPIPADPGDQVMAAIEAVFRSWTSRRARHYRDLRGIPEDLGTAATVQAMVFGNLDHESGTGVVFTRDPATGERRPYGDFLIRAQGEDVVSGAFATTSIDALGERLPECHRELETAMGVLESELRDLCDIEFTVERRRLFLLQVRPGKRSAQAAVRIAVDMAREGLITQAEAVERVDGEQMSRLTRPRLDPSAATAPLATGLPASPGAASGSVCLSSRQAREEHETGTSVILVRPETSPEDIDGIAAADGVLTARGGLASHAAVVARELGTPAVCGVRGMIFSDGSVTIAGTVVREGDVVTIDGSTGEVVLGEVPLVPSPPDETLATLLEWAQEHG